MRKVFMVASAVVLNMRSPSNRLDDDYQERSILGMDRSSPHALFATDGVAISKGCQ